MVTLQWGTSIGYDILVFDKAGNVAFLEVKSSASHPRAWILQSKYASPETDNIPLSRRFICCVDLASKASTPEVYVFPAEIVAKGLHYYFNSKFPKSSSYHLSLNCKPQGRTKEVQTQTVGEFIEADKFIDNYSTLGIIPVTE